MSEDQSMRKTRSEGTTFLGVMQCFLKRDVVALPFLVSVALVLCSLYYSKDIYSPGPGNSAVSLFIFPISWNNALGLVALAAGICSAANFAQERSTAYSRYILARITRRRYLVARFVSICLSTGAALLVAFLLFASYCLILAGGTVLPIDSSQVAVQLMSSLLMENLTGLWFLAILAIQFMFGVSLGGLGVCATVFAPNRFIGYSAPFIILFAWNQICSWLGLPAWVSPLGLAKCTLKVGGVPLTLAIYLGSFLAMTMIFLLVFYLKGNKEVMNDN